MVIPVNLCISDIKQSAALFALLISENVDTNKIGTSMPPRATLNLRKNELLGGVAVRGSREKEFLVPR